MLAASFEQVRALGVDVTDAAQRAGRRGGGPGRSRWPSASSPAARPPWLAGRDEVAVRIPDHDFLRALLPETGVLRGDECEPARRADAARGG